jgi:hypothetical protein
MEKILNNVHFFVLKSCDNSTFDINCLNILKKINKKIDFILDLDIINKMGKEYEWYFVLYDNESFSISLSEIFSVLLHQNIYDVFSFYSKKGDAYKISPRLFRKNIQLEKGCLMPLNHKQIIPVLNGFLIEN